ncbi:FAD-binding oxidoreductase [Nocardia blacklockiae]|uniref:FAD-binding oxidoreductase n=1 Tax=Nocardia blacklockiae TaxID=480036 RepID=UPI001894BB23|nr:FAD-binding oxidoreductase [Nocardia blacklockiae]MBF6169851.1 FAD-binding oxidoreductase [Nocardia blacklockiae]
MNHDHTVRQLLAEHPQSTDLGGHRQRRIHDTYFPASTEEVRQHILSAARTGIPLYPLSTGRNWGMGSRNPVRDNCAVLDLHRMTAVRTLDLDRGYAVVEPGVTQRRLAALLDGTPWMLNVTAGCADASIVGNTLERGDGTIRSRTEDLLGLEVVLGTGEIITTGGLDRNGTRPGCTAGPDLTRAFVQSNLGVVTAMAVGLIPRPEAATVVHATFDRSVLGDAVDATITLGRAFRPTLGMLRLKELFVVPDGAVIPDGADPAHVTIQLPVLGSRSAVRPARRAIRAILSEIPGQASLRTVAAESVVPGDPLYPQAQFARGTPCCANLQRRLGITACTEVDHADIGWLMFLPIVPLEREAMRTAVDLFTGEAERYGTAGMLEFNVVSSHSTNLVAQIPFRREPAAVARAHALRDAARRRFLDAGFPPYRSDIDHAPTELADRAATYSDGPLTALKQVYDPAGIIAPGRFLVTSR